MFPIIIKRSVTIVISLMICLLVVRYPPVFFSEIHGRRDKKLFARVLTSHEYSSSLTPAKRFLFTIHRRECNPLRSVVFAKTHKSGGSTLGSIIARYGYERNLSIALPRQNSTIFGTQQFQSSMLYHRSRDHAANLHRFHLLFNHVSFNKSAISEVMKADSKFITILRDPMKQFYSAVRYFGFQEKFLIYGNLSSSEYDLRNLLDKIKDCKAYRCFCTYNGQSADLGVFRRNHEKYGAEEMQSILQKLENEFDLVLLLEYFDESLILLRKLLCWEFTDILYLPKKGSDVLITPTGKHEEMVREWNYVDNALYHHFNRTLWRKIEEYGPNFGDDLNYFRLLRRSITGKCTAPFLDENDEAFKSLSITAKEFCDNLRRDVKPYTELFQEMSS